MSAYIIIQVEVTDEDKYNEYKKLTPATLEAFGGRFIVRGATLEHLEGHWDAPRVVILEFESVDRAREWYHSPGYQHAKSVREGAGTAVFTLLEGFEG